METQGHLGILHSNPLGVMCQSSFRCIAALPYYRRPGPRGRGGDFFWSGGCDRSGRIHSEPEAVTQGIGTRRQRIQGGPRERRGCGSSETAASNLHACSSAHNLACLAATPARSSSARRSFHLSTSFAARRERRSAQASILSAWMRCSVDLSKGLPAE